MSVGRREYAGLEAAGWMVPVESPSDRLAVFFRGGVGRWSA
jgi:hypothetical protein